MEEIQNVSRHTEKETGRLLDAPLLMFNLPMLMEEIVQEDSWLRNDRNAITLSKNSAISLVLIALRPGSEIDFRQNSNFIGLQLLKGQLNFHVQGESFLLEQGNMVTLHEDMPHSLTAVSETIFLLSVSNDKTGIV